LRKAGFCFKIIMSMVTKTKILTGLLLALFFPVGTSLAQYASPSYQVDETFFGSGGNLENSSANYKAKTAAGELGVGNVSSPNFQAYPGFNTSDRILLEVNVAGGVFDFGILDTSQVHARTTTFTVRDYLSSGYSVQLTGSPPRNGSYILSAMNSAASSNPGTEQFGVNLVANNLSGPGPFGAAPSQVPDSTFGFGFAASPYDTPNLFKYVEGDTVAQSDKSTGITQYTLSMIANVSRTTAGGAFGTSLFVRAVPTY
jgi:hypothetical protein